MNVPEGSKRLLDIKSTTKVGDVIEGANVEVFSRPDKDGDRFTDSNLYEKDRPLTKKRCSCNSLSFQKLVIVVLSTRL